MAYKVIARKWRPKNFLELVGQSSTRQTLINSLKNNRLYPVLLFTGPRGTGKTSSARILAKSLRCQNKKNFIPCDKCKDCLLIQESRHLDVIEIDGASNNGVEAVRELRDTVNYMPSTGRWKIYIIDEVHMLSKSAFNALLKTLEEPPGHVLFIMATTESHKIPKTVISRCQNLDFHKIPPKLIKQHLEKISKSENIAITEEVLWIITKQAQGSLRDAQSFLDQAITFGGNELSTEKVSALFGLSDPSLLSGCLNAIIQRNEKNIIQIIENIRKKGLEATLFLQNLIEEVRNFIFLKKNPTNTPELVHASSQEIDTMKQQMQSISYEDLHFLFDMLLKGEKEMAFAKDNFLVLEILLLRLCAMPRIESITPLNPLILEDLPNKQLTTDHISSYTTTHFNNKEYTATNKKKPTISKKQENNIQNTKKTDYAKTTNSQLVDLSPTVNSTTKNSKQKEGIQSIKLSHFLEFLQQKEPILASLIENTTITQVTNKNFCFIVPNQFTYLKNKLSNPKCQDVLQSMLEEFLNLKEKVSIQFVYTNNIPIKKKQDNPGSKHPFLQEVIQIFKGEIKSTNKTP